jgi:hypothetical protein
MKVYKREGNLWIEQSVEITHTNVIPVLVECLLSGGRAEIENDFECNLLRELMETYPELGIGEMVAIYEMAKTTLQKLTAR